MTYLLNILYVLTLLLASPRLIYAAVRKGKYRQGFAAKFLGWVPRRTSDRPCLWLHAVSVGEVNLLGTLIRELNRRHPQFEFVITTTTMTGYELAKKKYGGHTVCYCPLDFSWAVRAAMRRIRPTALVLAELELWPNLIRAARASGATVAVINGRLSERSYRGYRRLRPLFSRLLSQLDLIAVQNEEYAGRFLGLGAAADRVHVTGSLKFDGATTDRANPRTQALAALAGIQPGDCVFLAGSTQEPEEALALEAFQGLSPLHPRLRLILVPRHPDRFASVVELLSRSGLLWQRRSELDACGANPAARILLVDTVGELDAWWGTAAIGFVGGSFGPRGGQNMIEPAAYGAAVCFGPNTKNFRDIVALLHAANAAVTLGSGGELTAFVRRCLDDPRFATSLGERAQRLVQQQLGATARTVEHLEPLLRQSAPFSRRAAAA